MSHHNPIGFCQKCQEIFETYPNFHAGLRAWFEAVQLKHPDFHISCAGRGKLQQEEYFQRGATRAHYTQSSHNWNLAIDTFQLKDGNAFWTPGYYNIIVKPNLTPELEWYGDPKASFFELPHIEWKAWKSLVASGEASLVEPM